MEAWIVLRWLPRPTPDSFKHRRKESDKMAADKQTLGDFKGGVIERLATDRPELSKADINAVITAIVEQSQEDLSNGYEVPLFGLVKLVPTAKQGRKKGTEVRNPFDGTTRKLTKTEPDTVRIKARPMAAAKSAIPEGAKLKNLVAGLS